jgi:hypothetical protein
MRESLARAANSGEEEVVDVIEREVEEEEEEIEH